MAHRSRFLAVAGALIAVSALGSGTAQAMAAAVTAAYQAGSDKVFSRPHDLVLSPDGLRIYVADLGNHSIKVLDPESLAVVGSIGDSGGAGQLSSPHDVAFDLEGRLLVADTGNDRVARYEISGDGGTFLDALTGGLSAPEGVAAGPDGRIFVANARSGEIVVFEGTERIAGTGEPGSGPNQYQRPHDIAVSADGEVIVADPGNNRLQRLGVDLSYRGSIGGPRYSFNEPKYFDLDDRGLLAVADEYNHQIKLLDHRHKTMAVIGDGEPGEGPGKFNYPEGVELSGDLLWVSDTRNHRIVLYRLLGLPH